MVAYVTCIAIAKSQDTYTGGLDMPYFSDIGRDKPGYWVFSVFITTAAVLLVLLMPLQQRYLALEAPHRRRRATVSAIIGVVAALGAGVTSIADTNNYPDLHAYAAYVFFLFILLHALLTLSIYAGLAKDETKTHARLMRARWALMAVFGIAFVLYLPVGLAVVCEFVELSFQDCLDVMPEEDCLANLDDDDANTTLFYDYTDCPEVNTMRSSTQFICILTMMAYIAMYAFDPAPSSASGHGNGASGNSTGAPKTSGQAINQGSASDDVIVQ